MFSANPSIPVACASCMSAVQSACVYEATIPTMKCAKTYFGVSRLESAASRAAGTLAPMTDAAMAARDTRPVSEKRMVGMEGDDPSALRCDSSYTPTVVPWFVLRALFASGKR